MNGHRVGRASAIAALVAAAVGGVPGTFITAARAQVAAERQLEPLPRDLAADERMGGHTLARHVGKTDAELAARLKRERQISAASTYTDAETAAVVVGAALAQSKRRLNTWLARRGSRPNLVLNFIPTTGPPIGRSLRRGTRAAEPCYGALVVLRWNERVKRWYVLTSYPEALG